MYFYGDTEPRARLRMAGPALGLQEGEARLECPPGQVKAYLPEWPYQKCVPADEALNPRPGEVPIQPTAPPPERPASLPAPPPAPAAPAPVPELPSAPPAQPAPPGRARLLDLDEETGELLDPDTGRPIAQEGAFFLESTEGKIVVALVGIGVIGLSLFAIGAFGR